MPKPIPLPPAPDLARLSIHDLICLSDLFSQLAHTAMGVLNQPRLKDTRAEDFADELWDRYLHGMNSAIMEEIQSRVPVDRSEAEAKAAALINYLAGSDSYDDLLEAVTAAMKVRQHPAAMMEDRLSGT